MEMATHTATLDMGMVRTAPITTDIIMDIKTGTMGIETSITR